MTQEEAQSKCQSTYLSNLLYLEENNPDLFKKITLLEVAISEGMYKERYSLEFINNSFDVRVLADDTFVYNKDLDSDAIQRIQNITMDENKGFKTFKPIVVPQNYTINKDITKTYLEILFPFIEYSQKYSSKEFKMKKIEKFIFFGALLGRHIELFVKTHSPKVILITEQDIEMFKLSLFITDYSLIAQKTTIQFCITQDMKIFNDAIPTFLNEYELYNYILKFDIVNENYISFIDTFLNYLSISVDTQWPFSADLLVIKRATKLIKEKYNFIDFSKTYDIFSKDTPVIIVAPGPSMAGKIQWLKENQDKFIILSLGAAVQTLYKHNIKPDIITSVDPSILILNQFKGIPEEFLKDTILIAASNSIESLFDIFQKSNTYIYQVIFDLLNLGSFGGKSVGDVTIAILLRLGVKRLYLLGTDLCVNQETGSHYVKEHQHYKELDKVEAYDTLQNKFVTDVDIIETKGNFQDKIFTTRHFGCILYLYKQHIINFAYEDTKIFNLSDGSFIEKTIPLDIKDVNIKDKVNKQSCLNNITTEMTASNLTVKSLSTKISLVDKILKLLNKYKQYDYNTYNNMMYDKFTINIELIELLQHEERLQMGDHLIKSFNNNVEGYVNTFFNTKKNQVSKKRFNKLFQLWIKPQITIFEKYKELLENLDKKS